MTSWLPEFDLLLTAVDPLEGEMARNVLAAEGIPSVMRGPDFDMAELGPVVHAAVRHPDLFVPKGAHATARAVLVAAWGEQRVAELEPGAS